MAGCSDVCLDMDYGDDYAEFYREVQRTARKEHRCCECRSAILPSQQYWYATGKNDGSMWQAKTCASCYEIRRAFVCGSWIFGQLREEIENVMFPIWNESGPFDCLAKLETLEARRKVTGWYDEWRK